MDEVIPFGAVLLHRIYYFLLTSPGMASPPSAPHKLLSRIRRILCEKGASDRTDTYAIDFVSNRDR